MEAMDIKALRRAAEMRLKMSEEHKSVDLAAITPSETKRLIHELQTHQIELEMQNEALHVSQHELSTTRDHLKKLYDFAPVGYLTLTPKGIIKEVNLQFLKMLNVSREAVVENPLNHFIHPHSQDALYLSLLASQKTLTHQSTDICFQSMSKDGATVLGTFWGRIDTEPESTAEGVLQHVVVSVVDITEQRRINTLLEHQAFYDALTGLPNRQLFINRFNQQLIKAKRTPLFGALLYLDIDDFKLANDSFGHAFGDDMLLHVGKTLEQQIRATDTAARFGGDEFLILLTDLNENKNQAAVEAEQVARKIYEGLLDSLVVDERPFRVQVSIGIALFPEAGQTVDDIICQADIAMYRNKTRIKTKNKEHAPVSLFDEISHKSTHNRLHTYQRLRRALTQDEFFLQLQPQVTLEGQVIGAECLIRWQPSNEPEVPPSEFISILEDGSLIVEVGEWVLTQACQKLAEWKHAPDPFPSMKLAVNVSAIQFNQEDYVERAMQIINATGADPHRLVLEITENMSIMNLEKTIKKMNDLRHFGVVFSIDDFGTGYSSLTYIKRLPLDTLKIDRAFVRNIDKDKDNLMFVELFMKLADSFNFKVIVEGVETVEELSVLIKQGCQCFQGFHFSKPLSAIGFEAFCRKKIVPESL